eukprot:6188456-Pleurochrysis_carterae.AAC.1
MPCSRRLISLTPFMHAHGFIAHGFKKSRQCALARACVRRTACRASEACRQTCNSTYALVRARVRARMNASASTHARAWGRRACGRVRGGAPPAR